MAWRGADRATSRRKVEVADAEKQTFLQTSLPRCRPSGSPPQSGTDYGCRREVARRRAARAPRRAALLNPAFFPWAVVAGPRFLAAEGAADSNRTRMPKRQLSSSFNFDGADRAEFLVEDDGGRRRAAPSSPSSTASMDLTLAGHAAPARPFL